MRQMRNVLKPRWLDLILLAGIICLYLYITKSPELATNSPWLSLWSNVTTDLLTIWLASRVIEGIVTQRQRRQQVVLGFRGAGNFIMNIVADMMPNVYPWAIRRLDNEIRWFDMRLQRQGKYLRKDEKELTEKTLGHAKSILSASRDYSGFTREATRQRDRGEAELSRVRREKRTDVNFHELYAYMDLQREFREYMSDRDAEGASVIVAASEAQREVDTYELDDQMRTSMGKFIAAAKGAAERGDKVKLAINEYIQHVRDTEITLLGRVSD